MKEFKDTTIQPVQIINPETKIRRMEKRWITASNTKAAKGYWVQNGVVELFYDQILDLAKSLYSTLPDKYSRTVFEKDYRNDNTENSFAMHTFITPSFYWYLECHFAYYYHVEYDFHNCPFEEELRTNFERKFHYANGKCNQRKLKPNCEEFYKQVLKVQDAQYITIL